MRKFGKDKFWSCPKIILVEEMRKFGKDKFWSFLRIFLAEEMRKFGKDKFWNRKFDLERFRWKRFCGYVRIWLRIISKIEKGKRRGNFKVLRVGKKRRGESKLLTVSEWVNKWSLRSCQMALKWHHAVFSCHQ